MANVNARRIEDILTNGITSDHYIAGSNITITDNDDGTQTISASGGGGGGFTPTEDQLAAMNSGITSEKVGTYDSIEGVPAVTSTDDGKILTATYSGGEGTFGWASTPSVDEVPTVTSEDDGKVLTATYSGGTGSYAWATASGGGGTAPTDWTAPTYNTNNYIDNTNTIGGYVVVNNVCTVMIGFKFGALPTTSSSMGWIARGLPVPKVPASGNNGPYMFFDVNAGYQTGASNNWTAASTEKVALYKYRDAGSAPWQTTLFFLPAASSPASTDVVRWVSFSYLIDTSV